jgi:hypothetical protein
VEDNDPIRTVGTVQSWFEEHEGALQHLPWPAQSLYFNIIEPLWSVLETGLRNRFPSPTSLKQFEDVLQEEWYKNSLETIRNLYEFIPSRTAALLKTIVVQHDINEEICRVFTLFPFFVARNLYVQIHKQYFN